MFHFVFLKRSRLCRCKRWPNWRCNHWKTVSKYWQGKGWECLPDVQIHKRNNAMQQGFQSLQMLQTAEFVLNLATFFSERITFRGSFIWNVFESSFELENGIKNLWSHINIMFHLVTWLILNLSNEIPVFSANFQVMRIVCDYFSIYLNAWIQSRSSQYFVAFFEFNETFTDAVKLNLSESFHIDVTRYSQRNK